MPYRHLPMVAASLAMLVLVKASKHYGFFDDYRPIITLLYLIGAGVSLRMWLQRTEFTGTLFYKVVGVVILGVFTFGWYVTWLILAAVAGWRKLRPNPAISGH